MVIQVRQYVVCYRGGGRGTGMVRVVHGEWPTSDSNFLNSPSFCVRYSSISFWASDLASLTRLVRSGGSSMVFRHCRFQRGK